MRIFLPFSLSFGQKKSASGFLGRFKEIESPLLQLPLGNFQYKIFL
jgi:hypothetical protein